MYDVVNKMNCMGDFHQFSRLICESQIFNFTKLVWHVNEIHASTPIGASFVCVSKCCCSIDFWADWWAQIWQPNTSKWIKPILIISLEFVPECYVSNCSNQATRVPNRQAWLDSVWTLFCLLKMKKHKQSDGKEKAWRRELWMGVQQ